MLSDDSTFCDFHAQEDCARMGQLPHTQSIHHRTRLFEERNTGMSWMPSGCIPGHLPSAFLMAARYRGNTVDDGCWLKIYLCTVALKDVSVSPADVRMCHATYGAVVVAKEVPLDPQGL